MSTAIMIILFGTNSLLYLLFNFILSPRKEQTSDKDDDNGHGKSLSKPFRGTMECVTNLTSELNLTGMLMLITYCCERFPIFAHSNKFYDRDSFLFIVFLFFVVAIYTRKPTKDLTLLSRDQTEEWKGWMQFIFLLYHYFHAEEVYNSVRLMITCYVWMTGFGNFSFFYFKADYGWLRIVQMLWRLNFSVILLMMWHGNTYILYYICPLHTFYFLMTYTTMAIGKEYNYLKWPVRAKIFGFLLFVFLLWDINGGVFDIIFAWVGTDNIIGAGRGAVWEWYFRTSLDKYSAVFGMIFACNYPLTEQWFVSARQNGSKALICTGVVLGSAFLYYLRYIYVLEKLDYNLVHNYWAFVPLITYIFFRNITPGFRSQISMSLHTLGKTTLETYLLQHHVWLTSNAKTLLTIVPNHPYVNFAFASIFFYLLSKELYRLTMSLRGMLLPDDISITLANLKGMALIWIIITLFGSAVYYMQLGIGGIVISIAILFFVVVQILDKKCPDIGANVNFKSYIHTRYFTYFTFALAFLGFIYFIFGSMIFGSTNINNLSGVATPCQECMVPLSQGSWENNNCDDHDITRTAHCKIRSWNWDEPQSLPDLCKCSQTMFDSINSAVLYQNKRVVFVGDSNVRNIYHAFNAMVSDSYEFESQSTFKAHSDLHQELTNNINVDYIWAPFTHNVTVSLKDKRVSTANVIVLGAGMWDVLKLHSPNSYGPDILKLSRDIPSLHPKRIASSNNNDNNILSKSLQPVVVWLSPLPVINSLLTSDEKRTYMTEENMETFRNDPIIQKWILNTVSFTINPKLMCNDQNNIGDGVHYSEEVYNVMSQIITNGVVYLKDKTAKAPYTAKVTGSMSLEWHGFVLVIAGAVMLLTMDSFYGFGYLFLKFFDGQMSWENAYDPILKKMGHQGKDQIEMSCLSTKDDSSNSDTNDDENLPLVQNYDTKEVKI